MFAVSLGDYELRCDAGLPDRLSQYIDHASLADQIELAESNGALCFCSLTRDGDSWPYLVVAQRYEPAGYGFIPGVLLIPESQRLFIGAGRRLLAYDLLRPARLWEDWTECGFWFWRRWGEIVLMGAETEIAAWHIDGQKLWSRFVDPPWDYRFEGDSVVVTCDYSLGRINVRTGNPV
jgi:hypothetical protein